MIKTRKRQPKVITVRDRQTGMLVPKIRLAGYWLHDFGFTIDKLVTVAVDDGIILQLMENKDYKEVVRFAYKNNMKLLQIRKEEHNRGEPRACIDIFGSIIKRAELCTGDLLTKDCSFGQIKLQKLLPLGF